MAYVEQQPNRAGLQERFPQELRFFIEQKDQYAKDRFQVAAEAVDTALLETIKYMRDEDEGRRPSVTKDQLGDYWQVAARAVEPINGRFADACRMKGLGWIEPRFWDQARDQGILTSIDSIIEMRSELRKSAELKPEGISVPPAYQQNLPPAAAHPTAPSWFPIAGGCFLLLAVLFAMYVFINGLPTDRSQRLPFSVVIGLICAATGYFLGGTAEAHGQIPIPFMEKSPISFRTAGGIAAFVVVFLLVNYAR